MHFGHTLRTMRKAAGLSLRGLAHQVGVSPAYLSQVEHGTAAPPTEARLRDIARVFGVPTSYLSCLTGRVSPDAIAYLQEVPEVEPFLVAARKAGLGRADFAGLAEALDGGKAAALREWVRRAAAGRARRSAGRSRLASALDERLLWCRLHVERKAEILRVLSDGVGRLHASVDPNVTLHRLLRREAEASTGIGSEVAVPHAAVDGLKGNVVGLATLARGVEFRAIDKRPVRIVFMLVGPEVAAAGRLSLLARVARMARHPGFVQELLRARSRRDLLSRVRRVDGKVA